MNTKLKVARINPEGPAKATNAGATREALQRVLFLWNGGTGRRLGTHKKALETLDGMQSGHLYCDSDHGDNFETTLPGGRVVKLEGDQVCHFGVEDPRTRLMDQPSLQRRYRRLLRGNPVANTYGRGAGQCRPIGILDYELDIARIERAMERAIEPFYPVNMGKRLTLSDILNDRVAEAERNKPLSVWIAGSASGGLNSSIFIHHAYYMRRVLEKRGITNVSFFGVLLGPKAFQKRGPNTALNHAALMREVDRVYRDGFSHTFPNGEAVQYARPPFKLLFQLDLADWPADEDPAARLSDAAMDAWLRQIALGIHLLSSPAMHDRLQSLVRNPLGEGDTAGDEDLGLAATFNPALASVNLGALEQTIALEKAGESLDRLIARCSE